MPDRSSGAVSAGKDLSLREINPEMEKYIDEKLKGFGAAQDAIAKKDARLLMQYAALACVGIKESGGNNMGKYVRLMTDTVDEPGAIPWCAAGVQTWIAYAEKKTGIRSPIEASEHVLTIWNYSPKGQRVKFFPLPGAIIIWRHGKTTSGHTGLFLEGDSRTLMAVECNTGGGLDTHDEVVREGDGCYRTRRTIGKIGDMDLVGFLRPF